MTHVCSLDQIPVEDQRYDAVILTQVLEHLPDPKLVLKELNRVLKPGGKLYLTAPLFYPEHEQPYDFFRYTQFSLDMLCKHAGFEIEEIDWLEGYFGTLSFQLEQAANKMPWKPSQSPATWLGAPILLGLRPLFMVLSLWFARLDLRKKITTHGQCKNYALIAKKVG